MMNFPQSPSFPITDIVTIMILLLRIASVGENGGQIERNFTFWCLSEPESDEESCETSFPPVDEQEKHLLGAKFGKLLLKVSRFQSACAQKYNLAAYLCC